MSKTLTELEAENERLEVEITVAKQRALLAELRKQGGDNFWKRFSVDGTKAGIVWQRVMGFLHGYANDVYKNVKRPYKPSYATLEVAPKHQFRKKPGGRKRQPGRRTQPTSGKRLWGNDKRNLVR